MNHIRGEIDRTLERAGSASLGFLADDVVLATFDYPELTEVEESALGLFIALLDGFAQVDDESFAVMAPPAQMRMATLSDSLRVLKLSLKGPNSHEAAALLRDAATAILGRQASGEQLSDVRDCADSLGRVTLDRLMELQSRGASPWKSQTLVFS